MTKVTNISPGPRGLHAKEGLVFVDPYQVWEGEIDEAALKSALDTGWFAKGEKKAPGDEGDSEEVLGLKRDLAARDQQIAELRAKLEVSDAEIAKLKGEGGGSDDRDELKKQATELGIEYPANVKTEKLKELIDAKLAE